MSNNDKKFSMLPIFLVVLIDMIGIGIAIPVVASLFLSTDLLFGPSISFATRTIILGFLIASYPLAQFFGAPILGALSDNYGRKKILIISLIGTFIGYILFGIGIITQNLSLLFISRIIDGFTGGNITIAMASIADISSKEEKVKRFGIIGMSFGFGMIIGPVIGGILANNNIVSWFNYATPFFFAATLCAINIALFILMFNETLTRRRKTDISLYTGIKNLKRALNLNHQSLKTVFLFAFLFTLGFSFYTQFSQIFLIEKFSITTTQIGIYFGYLGICIVLTQGIIVRKLAKHFKPENILPFSALGISLSIILILLPKNMLGIYIITAMIAICAGLTMPNLNALVSNLTPKDEQGEIIGINQSIQSLAMAIPPIIAGFFAAIYYKLPVIIGSAFIFLAWIIFITLFKKAHKETQEK